MLEQVYNIILNIPDYIVASIPSLKNPSVLAELKRMRQKIKNKIKIGKTRLLNEDPTPSTSCNNNISYRECESRTSFTNDFDTSSDSQHERQNLNYTDNSRLNTTYNRTNTFDDTNITNNKWFNNQSDFHMNSTPLTGPTPSYTNIYSRERLTINQLDSIVNDNNFDSFSISNNQKLIQTGSVNNFSCNISENVETKIFPSKNSTEGKKL